MLLRTLIPLCLAFAVAVPAPADARPRTGPVDLSSNPPGASIFVDSSTDKPIGKTPWRGRLPVGKRTIKLALDGHVAYESTIDVTWRRQRLVAKLEPQPKPAVIEVNLGDATITNAKVWIDGVELGAPPRSDEVAAGRHLVEISAPDRQRFSQWLEVREGQRLLVSAAHLPKKQTTATLLVDTDVTGAEVYLDGARVAGTPPLIVEVKAGNHVVEVRRAPAEPYRQRIVARAGERVIVSASLADEVARKRPGTLRITSSVGAAVKIDKREHGSTPLLGIELAPGEHLVELSADGFAAWSDVVDVPAGGSFVVAAELVPAPTPITVVTPTAGARVLVDGVDRGTTPWQGKLERGTYVVRVEHAGFEPFTTEVILGADPVRVAATLEAKQVLAPTRTDLSPLRPAPPPPTALFTGAGALPRDTYAVSAWTGYPYFAGGRVRTGLVGGPWPVDISIGIETYVSHWGLRGGSSVTLYQGQPFHVGAYANLHGGLGTDGRNGFGLDAGAAITLDAGRWLDLTARVGVTTWSDRVCGKPAANDADGLPDDAARVCRADATADDLRTASDLLGRTVSRPGEPGDPHAARAGNAGRIEKARGHKSMMHGKGKSDRSIVPTKRPNKTATAVAEDVEGRDRTEGNADEQTRTGHRTGNNPRRVRSTACVRERNEKRKRSSLRSFTTSRSIAYAMRISVSTEMQRRASMM